LGPSALLNVCAGSRTGDVRTNDEAHAHCKRAVANQNFEIFMRPVISQHGRERNRLAFQKNAVLQRIIRSVLALILGEGQIPDERNRKQTGYREQQNDDNHGVQGPRL
jgi:hypothetical protein